MRLLQQPIITVKSYWKNHSIRNKCHLIRYAKQQWLNELKNALKEDTPSNFTKLNPKTLCKTRWSILLQGLTLWLSKKSLIKSTSRRTFRATEWTFCSYKSTKTTMIQVPQCQNEGGYRKIRYYVWHMPKEQYPRTRDFKDSYSHMRLLVKNGLIFL